MLRLHRRAVLRMLAPALLAAGGVPALALRPAIGQPNPTQAYPTRAVRIIAPYSAGGANDIIARLVAQWFSERTKGAFFVENRGGAGSNIGTEAALRAPPDGYTLLSSSTANAANTALYPKLKFDFLKDSAPVGMIGMLPNVLVVHPSMPVSSLQEFIAYAKANPGKVNMGLPGIGSPQHLSAALFAIMTGCELTFAQYQGGGAVINDLVGGHVQASFSSSASSAKYIQAGTLRGLGVTSAQRLALLPSLPAIGEVVPGYEANNFYGVSAPKGTPQDIIALLNRELEAATHDSTMVARLEATGLTPHAMSPAEYGAFLDKETEKWAKVIRTAGITVD